MKTIFHNPERSIAAKLIIATGLLIVLVSFIFWYATLKKQQKDIMTIAIKYGNSFVDFSKESVHHSMLNNNVEETQRVLETLSTPEGVQKIRIFNHKGVIRFSSDKESVGAPVDRSSIACTGCHADAEKSPALLPEKKTWAVYKDERGYTSLRMLREIPNEQGCYTAACHAHPQENAILGFIETDLSLALLDEALFKQGLALTAYVVVFVIAVSIFLGIINYKIVTHPVHELAKGMEKAASGDFDHT
ncbi:MAG: hypothetical protein OEU95_03400, partial [Nitrospirota bacterium]|nr:hypothetical protein [Nitrospirota bacterium]